MSVYKTSQTGPNAVTSNSDVSDGIENHRVTPCLRTGGTTDAPYWRAKVLDVDWAQLGSNKACYQVDKPQCVPRHWFSNKSLYFEHFNHIVLVVVRVAVVMFAFVSIFFLLLSFVFHLNLDSHDKTHWNYMGIYGKSAMFWSILSQQGCQELFRYIMTYSL